MDRLKFRITVLKRALSILPRRSKAVKLIEFTHLQDRESENTVIIRYNFENALWYQFNNKKTFSTRQAVLRPEKGEQQLKLTVCGLYGRHTYIIIVKHNTIQLSGICKTATNKHNKDLYTHASLCPHLK